MEIDLQALIEAIMATIAIIIAAWKTKQTSDIVKYASDEVTTKPTPAVIPAWMYSMPDSVISFATVGMPDADKVSFVAQVKAAEAQKLQTYKVTLSKGSFTITKGQISSTDYAFG